LRGILHDGQYAKCHSSSYYDANYGWHKPF
jgi:hypothetical protein